MCGYWSIALFGTNTVIYFFLFSFNYSLILALNAVTHIFFFFILFLALVRKPALPNIQTTVCNMPTHLFMQPYNIQCQLPCLYNLFNLKQSFLNNLHVSRLMGKPTICLCENKGADQLRGNREADQRLCFRYSDSTIPPLINSKISSF